MAIQDMAYQLTGESNQPEALKQLALFYEMKGNRFSQACIWVKEVDNELAGMILCYHGSQAVHLYQPIIDHLRQSSGNASFQIEQEADEDEYYIDALAVSPNHQGKGFAKELIAAAEWNAAELKYTKIALNVDQENLVAHRLYQRLGYEADKEIFIHHKPYWHMAKTLRQIGITI
ncbi:GNAT family N-acetyltransferase [Paenibacillus eucommiae]|uniref:Ribosomal protein S18 acetylase RimI-like enzyme n=1 Tax=Paenibacillus eucommiae TaxID=1355755 RepID=A0ABS4J4Z9_9BACL|nr:GNAT family N-acetyltransferase [Paenibacillus eucommiae]MBP1994917.1 ribosomal protein S18 acetylase RimI-like enzyme [Paenibacillus eucommiae]